MLITVAEIKTHLRIDYDVDSNDDPIAEPIIDAELTAFYDAAVDYVTQYIDREIPLDNGKLPPSLRAAILLVIGGLHENREANFVGTIQTDNPQLERLMHFYRVGLGV